MVATFVTILHELAENFELVVHICICCCVCNRVVHAYAEYAVHADYAHMREYADADENLIHIIHI